MTSINPAPPSGPTVAASMPALPETGAQPTARPSRMGAKPQTPRSSYLPRDHTSNGSSGLLKPKSSNGDLKRVKPTFTTCLEYPAPLPSVPAFDQVEDAELNRNQRRSKVQALTKLDRAGTPIPIAGPGGTSFLPAGGLSASAGPSGPSISKNPLHKPLVTNPTFDISSVRQDGMRHAPNRSGSRLFGLEECPVFRPTEAEFSDPMAYIDKIGPLAKPYGICKIIPPEGWHMPFTLDTASFRFRTRLQRLNSLEAASRAKINFLEQLSMFHLQQGDSTATIPVIDRKPLDLWQLRKEVNKLGGHEEVTRLKGWPIISQTMGFNELYGPSIKSAYIRIILPFDNFALRARSVSGSPLTPIPSTTKSKPPGFVGESPASPTRHGKMSSAAGPSTPTRISPRSGQTEGNGPKAKSLSPPGALSVPTLSLPNGSSSKATTPFDPEQGDAINSANIKIKVPGFSNRDGSESELSDEEMLPSRQNGKRVAPLPEYQKGEVCEVCRRGDVANKILLCDGCDRGFHTFCLDPPLAAVPTNEEWFCTPCLLSRGDDFGFEDGEDHSLASFLARDSAFSNAWWQRHRPSSSQTVEDKRDSGLSRSFGKVEVSEDDVEKEFWRLTESSTDTVEVEYGADVHSTTHGSGSPTTETHPLNKYSADDWNLNNMPIVQDSLLRYIKSDISGMTVPWIYVGMMFSAFCWHNEDHYTYSVNYMHWGETKTWYGIPGSDAEKFEQAMKSEAPDLFEQQPSLLYHLTTMMNPGRVTEAGVKVVACDQRPNEFVITYPKAYHCGFNHGTNFNEAVNFALPDWLPDGLECIKRYKLHHKVPVFSHNELLVTIALFSDTIKTALWLAPQFRFMVEEETARRDKLRAAMPNMTEALEEEDCPEEQYQCCTCKGFCYLSQVTCSCTKLVSCLEHADTLCSCDKGARKLRKRYSEAQLEEMLASVEAKAEQPNAWRARLDALLDVPRPPLKTMKAVLADGERIAYPMPEVVDLRNLISRASAWVEQVTTLTTRKSTGRRRKGRQHAADTEEEEMDKSPTALNALLKQVERLAFDAPEIMQLRQILLSIESFQSQAALITSTPENELDIEECRTALILGNSLSLDMPEIRAIQNIVNRLEWFNKVESEVDDRTLSYEDVQTLLEQADECGIQADHVLVQQLRERQTKGKEWKQAVESLLASKTIRRQDLVALIENQELTPTSIDTMRQLETMHKTIAGWESSARTQLSAQGSVVAAQRLCKAVKTATGPLGRVEIPEISQLQAELDYHAEWQNHLAVALKVQPKQLMTAVTNMLRGVEAYLDPNDTHPSDAYSCFCRTAPAPGMVTCLVCNGEYHPKCVSLTAKNLDKPFRCAMCEKSSLDDRPSLVLFARMTDTNRYSFLFKPVEFSVLDQVVDRCVQYSRYLLRLTDPLGDAVPCRDYELLATQARKLFNLPFVYNAENPATKTIINFEAWLYKRMSDARAPAKGQKRPRKPKLVLVEAHEGERHCICASPPADALVDIRCVKCSQIYHASCVKAPNECLGSEGKPWRCPCCTVKEAKRYQQGGIGIRVQMHDRVGTNCFVDYRTTLNSYANSVLEYNLDRPDPTITLTCKSYIKPIIPDGFVPPSIDEVRSTRFDDEEYGSEGKKKKRKTTKGAIEAGKATTSSIDLPHKPTASVSNGAVGTGSTNGDAAKPPSQSHVVPPKSSMLTNPKPNGATNGAAQPSTSVRPSQPTPTPGPSLPSVRPTYSSLAATPAPQSSATASRRAMTFWNNASKPVTPVSSGRVTMPTPITLMPALTSATLARPSGQNGSSSTSAAIRPPTAMPSPVSASTPQSRAAVKQPSSSPKTGNPGAASIKPAGFPIKTSSYVPNGATAARVVSGKSIADPIVISSDSEAERPRTTQLLGSSPDVRVLPKSADQSKVAPSGSRTVAVDQWRKDPGNATKSSTTAVRPAGGEVSSGAGTTTQKSGAFGVVDQWRKGPDDEAPKGSNGAARE